MTQDFLDFVAVAMGFGVGVVFFTMLFWASFIRRR